MADIVFVTGGARSGKSKRAENLTLAYPGRPIYIATAEFIDDGMATRIDTHRERRGAAWDLAEAPIELANTLHETDGRGARLVDCLTVWLSNLMHHGVDWRMAGKGLADALSVQRSPVVLVSNEVGLGILPENALARDFCDAAGQLNQQIASIATSAELVVAGLPLKLK